MKNPDEKVKFDEMPKWVNDPFVVPDKRVKFDKTMNVS
jgi:hypothetical protein